MSPSANGPENDPEPPDWRRSITLAAVTTVVTSVLAALAGWVMGHFLRLSSWVIVPAVIAVVVAVLAVIFWERVRKWTAASWPVLWPTLLSGTLALVLALAANTVLARSDPGRACGKPIDLRVVAAEETVTALRGAAQTYERERCPAASISVVPEPSITGMETGFTSGWAESPDSPADNDTLYGPQPDIWIADSPVTADGMLNFVRHANSDGRNARLDIGKTIASSPVVLGLFQKDSEGAAEHQIAQDGISNGTTLSNLVTDLYTKAILKGTAQALRALPDTSESALLTTPALYHVSPGLPETQVEQDQVRIPEQIPGSAQAFPDETAMLCHFRDEQEAGASPPGGTAVLLPEQSVYAYDSGEPAADSCPAAKTQPNWSIYPYYASGLPVLDYTFVHVRWAGQDDPERYRTVEDFQRWLIRNAATALAGFRDPGGQAAPALVAALSYASTNFPDAPPASVAPNSEGSGNCGHTLMTIMNCYYAARPHLVATILLDVSGSMTQETARGLSRLAWAQQTGEGIAQLSHPQDSLSFAAFASSARGSRPTGQLTQQALISDLRDQVASGYDKPLATEIGDVIGSLPPGQQNIVVLTDGQRTPTNPGYAAAAGDLAAAIRSRHPALRVVLALTGGANCASDPVRTLAAALRSAGVAGGCVSASSSPAASAAGLFADLLK